MAVLICKFGNFGVTFILQIFNFRFISEFFTSRADAHIFFKAYSGTLLARTLNSRDNKFANMNQKLSSREYFRIYSIENHVTMSNVIMRLNCS